MSVTQIVERRAPSTAGGIDAVIEEAIRAKRIVGTVVLAAVDGRIVYQRAAGFADRERASPMCSDSIFLLASVTKALVSSLVMQLIEQGRLKLEDSVRKYLPEFRPRLPNGHEPNITLRHLLTHTSGLSYRFAQPAGSDYDRLDVSDGMDQPGLSLEENLRRLSLAPLLFEPGTAWGYSLGVDVLGGVVENVLSQSLAAAIRDRITGPLGLVDTAFHVTDPARLVTHYADGQPEPVRITDGMELPGEHGALRVAPSRIRNTDSYPSGGAGMAGTAGDIFHFLEEIRRGGPILSPATPAEMMRDQVGSHLNVQGPGWGFGLGWSVLLDPMRGKTPQSCGTIEWGGAYGHRWFVDPVRNLTVVLLTNTAFEGVFGAFPFELRDAIYQSLN